MRDYILTDDDCVQYDLYSDVFLVRKMNSKESLFFFLDFQRVFRLDLSGKQKCKNLGYKNPDGRQRGGHIYARNISRRNVSTERVTKLYLRKVNSNINHPMFKNQYFRY